MHIGVPKIGGVSPRVLRLSKNAHADGARAYRKDTMEGVDVRSIDRRRMPGKWR
jgi:hypothetical protein